MPTDSPSSRRRDRFRRAATCGAALFVGAALPVPLPSRWRPASGPYGPDKWLHFLGHVALAWSLASAVADRPGRAGGDARPVVVAAGVSVVYGAWLEWIQRWVPGRSAERGDVAAGTLGALFGIGAWRRFR